MPGLTHQWINNHKILACACKTTEPETIDRWIVEIEQSLSQSSPEHPLYTLQDLTQITLTPYMRHRFQELIDKYPQASAYSAMILPKSIVAQLFRLFVMPQMVRYPNHTMQFFFSEADALAWLNSQLKDTISAKL